ncbi:2-(3-amino-3-carboxypropyl)histidine synthase subunit 2 [Psilocybe cubensis]|uniref:2-(3-amino-3-carboxypropyl)histidine synthase subunit 2 n=2 Tax=Psilocybe cubensis TaxID=181762 RepID=A0A8H7XNR7_PSICU|nr:2-(3-amino-3-carboxypropyl)histidine synthase subunit 2 [Psilocybe cubensis]KAH9475326.1 2-(3-amino-3-carboxypropyl)histidine synthase subunit 2 [Psilocybe cubensis]
MAAEPPTTSFSSSGEDVISQVIEVTPDTSADVLSLEEFDIFYEIRRTAEEIVRGDYKRIALQFPDELLHDSVPIFRRLNKTIAELEAEGATSTIRELYVLADTSYGSCCVDEVAAQHANADLIVHYGHACMTQTSRLPAIYVFGQKQIDVERCVAELMRVFNRDESERENTTEKRAVLLKHDVTFAHKADEIVQCLRQALSQSVPPIPLLYHKIPEMTYPSSATSAANPSSHPVNDHDPETDFQLEHTIIFYVGGESLGLSNLLMTNSSCNVYTYNPTTQTALHESATGRTNKMLMRRYVAVQKARDADVFGILVGTLGVASYLPLISHIRRLLARKQKKSYTISVGKLNPAKLANFLEVECFVLIACPENSLIQDKEFLRPIITPYELEVAMQAEQSWTGRYVLDFEKLLADAKATAPGEGADDGTSKHEDEGTDSDPDQPVFSLVTGTYRHAKRYGGKHDVEAEQSLVENTSAMVIRNKDDQVAMIDSAAGQFLQQRTYQGLEVRMGEDAPSVLEQGRSGIARGYQDDKSHKEFE